MLSLRSYLWYYPLDKVGDTFNLQPLHALSHYHIKKCVDNMNMGTQYGTTL